MFLDASATVGIIAAEQDAASLAGRLSRARAARTSAVAVTEAAIALARIADAAPQDAPCPVERFLAETGTEIQPIDKMTARLAVQAFPVRPRPASSRAELRRLLCLCLCPADGGATAMQGNDFPRYLA